MEKNGGDIRKMKYTIKTESNSKGIVTQKLMDVIGDEFAKWVADTRDEQFQAIMVRLGWTRPSEKQKCPYCEKENFIPDVVFRHVEAYGDTIHNFRCLHCDNVVKASFHIVINVDDPVKTKEEGDWG